MTHNHTCIICSSFSVNENISNLSILCKTCKNTLEQLFLPNVYNIFCPTCGQPMLSEENCVNCPTPDLSLKIKKQACFPYNNIIKELITYYKFKNIIQLSEIFADFILRLLQNYNTNLILVPIPGNPGNIRKRGWDQVSEITKHIKHSNIQVHSLLKQKKKHSEQKSLDKSQRIAQAKNKYTIDRKILCCIKRDLSSFPLSQVVLIDDIITTGATLNSAAAAILEVLEVPVHAVTLAMD